MVYQKLVPPFFQNLGISAGGSFQRFNFSSLMHVISGTFPYCSGHILSEPHRFFSWYQPKDVPHHLARPTN